MKYFLITVFLLPAFCFLNAQQGTGKVIYRMILNLKVADDKPDSTGTSAFLFFKQGQSVFIYNSSDTKKNDSMLVSADALHTYDLNTSDQLGEIFFSDYGLGKLTMREFVWKKPYISSESIPVINWSITKDTKNIGKMTCHKAVTTFRGRKYIAWFTYDIPLHMGPWKLNGLPGLILEAGDDANEVQFKFESLEIPWTEHISFIAPTQGDLVPISRFRDLWKTETEKLQKFFQSTAEKGTIIDMSLNHYPIEKTYE